MMSRHYWPRYPKIIQLSHYNDFREYYTLYFVIYYFWVLICSIHLLLSQYFQFLRLMECHEKFWNVRLNCGFSIWFFNLCNSTTQCPTTLYESSVVSEFRDSSNSSLQGFRIMGSFAVWLSSNSFNTVDPNITKVCIQVCWVFYIFWFIRWHFHSLEIIVKGKKLISCILQTYCRG